MKIKFKLNKRYLSGTYHGWAHTSCFRKRFKYLGSYWKQGVKARFGHAFCHAPGIGIWIAVRLVNGDLSTRIKQQVTLHLTTHHKPIVTIYLVEVVSGVRFKSQNQSHVGAKVSLPKVPLIDISGEKLFQYFKTYYILPPIYRNDGPLFRIECILFLTSHHN